MSSVPSYPDFKPLQLEDQGVISQILQEFPPTTSELTFTNLFVWRHRYQFQWSVVGNALLVIGKYPQGGFFGLPPVGADDLSQPLECLFNKLHSISDTAELHRVPLALAKRYAAALALEWELDRANSDYVYRTETLISLSGRKLHRKRNHLNQFRRRYSYRYQPLTEELIEACLALQEDWCRLRDCQADELLLSEEGAIRELLAHFRALSCKGGALVVDDKVVAFTVGEQLNRSTAVIHVEKADPEYTGSYVMINQQFCLHAWRDFPFINREQDLGEPGLRKAKLSYYPDHLVDKVILRSRR
ncbi:MAG: DUF2156 domain-containing protein [Deltaproteobacteria bacterium]|nr:DUF2156 domain-containing protein [Deltaproteobacteria bacterium]MBW2071617.1 DUF2156 domain-containing protein [Deltaproteobacteria bacterium]